MPSPVNTGDQIAVHEKNRADATSLCAALDIIAYDASATAADGLTLVLARSNGDKVLVVAANEPHRLRAFDGNAPIQLALDTQRWARLCPRSAHNAALLRELLPHLVPVMTSSGVSIGTGDRLGVATPGHIQAIAGRGVFPVLAQQSIREMSRTGRTPREVLDDAMWGVFESGYYDGYGADADHLQTLEDVAQTEGLGYTMFTIDPNRYVGDNADRAPLDELAAQYDALPWALLRSSAADCRHAYADRQFVVGDDGRALRLHITSEELLRAAVKYGRAVAQTAILYGRLLERHARPTFALELSVDETAHPTSAAEHYYIVAELRRLGIQLDGFAPRFVGEFYKGVEYVGDLEQFRAESAKHAAIASHFGGYKLSLHSGSDKFAIYPIIADLAGESVHVKTAGTSYLEALRVVARTDPPLFREILAHCIGQYESDRNSYHVSASVDRVRALAHADDAELPSTLDNRDARQVCHVTFGSVLSDTGIDGEPLFRERLLRVLHKNEAMYHGLLREHFVRHVVPFT